MYRIYRCTHYLTSLIPDHTYKLRLRVFLNTGGIIKPACYWRDDQTSTDGRTLTPPLAKVVTTTPYTNNARPALLISPCWLLPFSVPCMLHIAIDLSVTLSIRDNQYQTDCRN